MEKKVKNSIILTFLIIFSLIIITIGMSFNFKVMTTNSGKMPIKSYHHFEKPEHFGYIEDSEVNYPLLSDRIKIFEYFWSIGDLVMIFGFVSFVILIILFGRNIHKIKNDS